MLESEREGKNSDEVATGAVETVKGRDDDNRRGTEAKNTGVVDEISVW